ncbi:hypothetical protein FUT69_04185 [Xylella taiwanensis]|uniref:Uncharacterized protein n=1 Tax=Xylella taiwanensis TaxID=1444770 RepID=Z9JFX3_9GAMM|nr:hypothetical protein [Xylella taiwanensis]AXI84407.1 hypothetical protein AB672_10945 [Xylella taiwanensis]EWS76928.1 hypothetical protein AF72_13575 [Xylella taiwanensis]MCD8455291.1 hypothetical protein [Xylella taiwanensis]MCD8457697.1 hypothetical protein [Xylella taiwanensis]MCD8459835.1 hypothetical protein [Xylella taiwanensis]
MADTQAVLTAPMPRFSPCGTSATAPVVPVCGYGEWVNVVSGTALAAMVLAYPHLRTAPI